VKVARFVLAERDRVEQFVDELVDREHLVRDRPVSWTRVVFDTFDWRLHGHGSVLEHERAGARGQLVWRDRDTGEVLGRFELAEVPRFVWDLPPGPVTDRLAEVVEVRALLPLVTIEGTRTPLRLLDDESKTVARVVVDTATVQGGDSLPPVVEVQPVRGYERQARRLAGVLAAQVVLTPATCDLAETALRSAGFVPGSYSSKLRVQLDPHGTALEAWVTVLRTLLATMEANEAGVLDDLDSEFLHDYRVAVRRTRSVLGQARRVLPASVRDRFRVEFAWLGRETGPTRDFDVFLLEVPRFAARLPAERRPDLEPFRAFLERRQRAAHEALVEVLRSARYEAFLRDWRAFLDDPVVSPQEAPDAPRPATEVAADRIRRAYRRVVRDGRAIHDGSAPEELHELRKDAKKLRYALECYGSLFPAGEVAAVVKDLKGLQDVLGEYQDCQVQAGSLEHFAQEMLEEGTASAAVLITLGYLVEQLDEREAAARRAFEERFARFDAPEAHARMRALLRSGTRPEAA